MSVNEHPELVQVLRERGYRVETLDDLVRGFAALYHVTEASARGAILGQLDDVVMKS